MCQSLGYRLNTGERVRNIPLGNRSLQDNIYIVLEGRHRNLNEWTLRAGIGTSVTSLEVNLAQESTYSNVYAVF